jgi:hypothetical protein
MFTGCPRVSRAHNWGNAVRVTGLDIMGNSTLPDRSGIKLHVYAASAQLFAYAV